MIGDDMVRESGWILWVDQVPIGDVLLYDHPNASLILQLADAEAFDEDGGTLKINGVLLRYESADLDEDTVTLLDPLIGAALEGDEVHRWDENAGEVAQEFEGQVELVNDEDGDDDPIDVVLSHGLGDRLARGVRNGRGESVIVEREADSSTWSLVNVVGSALTMTTDYLSYPGGLGILNADTPLPAGPDWVTVKNFGAYDLVDVEFNSLTGIWTIRESGAWTFVFTARVSGDSQGGVGARSIRAIIHYLDGTTVTGNAINAAPLENVTALQLTEQRGMAAGHGVSFQVQQRSGETLQLVGSNGNMDFRPTNVTLDRRHA